MHMGQITVAYKIPVVKIMGRLDGRPWHRQEDNIRNELL
jgi:hypothetical protein